MPLPDGFVYAMDVRQGEVIEDPHVPGARLTVVRVNPHTEVQVTIRATEADGAERSFRMHRHARVRLLEPATDTPPS